MRFQQGHGISTGTASSERPRRGPTAGEGVCAEEAALFSTGTASSGSLSRKETARQGVRAEEAALFSSHKQPSVLHTTAEQSRTGEAGKGAVHGVVRENLAVDPILARGRDRANHVRGVDVLDIRVLDLAPQDCAQVAADVGEHRVAARVPLVALGEEILHSWRGTVECDSPDCSAEVAAAVGEHGVFSARVSLVTLGEEILRSGDGNVGPPRDGNVRRRELCHQGDSVSHGRQEAVCHEDHCAQVAAG